MRSRVLALFLVMVFGLVGHWSALAGQLPVRLLAGAGAGLALADVQVGDPQRGDGSFSVSAPVAGSPDGPAPVPDPATAHPAEPLAETWGHQSLAEGSPDLPALFLTDPRACAPTATMAPPRPHAAAAWRRLYPSVPLRPPRPLPAIA